MRVQTEGAAMDYELVKADLVRWATAEDNIRAILITGSGARGQMDDLSDLDVELYVRDPAPLLSDGSWYERLGDVLVVEALPNPGWIPTRLVYYVGGKLDFGIAAAESLANSEHTRPLEVLVDKDGAGADLTVAPDGRSGPPSLAEFDEVVHWFWAEALMCARAIARQEPWIAMLRGWNANQNLLRMVEWDHKVRYGWAYDTWWQGKHLSTWADPCVVDDLARCFAHLDTTELAVALSYTITMFEEVATRTAEAIVVAVFDHARARAEVQAILAQRLQ
jgi:aminoglycoside 6-adenylyltransferase